MSMISAQCDELRKAADKFDGYQNGEISRLLREAADTIWELRGALLVAAKEHRELEAENAKLRELVLTLAFCANDEADCDQCPMNGVRCDVVQQCFCDGAAETLRELGIEVG